MWGPVIEDWGKKKLIQQKIIEDNDLDYMFDDVIRNLDLEIKSLQKLKIYFMQLKEAFSKKQETQQDIKCFSLKRKKHILSKKRKYD